MKWLYNHLEYFLVFFLLVVLFFFIFQTTSPSLARVAYAETLFGDSRVHRIELSLSSSDFNKILDSPTEKIKYHADVKIDGEFVTDVALATRGNATLFAGAEDENFSAYSYKIDFQKWHEKKTYLGLDTLYLNNFFTDPSYLKEYLAYYLMRSASVPAPLTSYAEVYINGELQGFYLAIEGYDKSYLRRTGANPDSALLKPEPLAHDNSRFAEFQQLDPASAENYPRDVFAKDYDTEGADLVYRGDAPASYPAIFKNSLSKLSPANERTIISAIKTLAVGSDAEFETAWDFDALARYAAVHNFIINSDSYLGTIAHNYLLKLDADSNQLSLLPWDYDLAAYVNWRIEGYSDIESISSVPFDEPPLGVPSEERPLWNRLINNPTFREKYVSAFRDLLTSELFSDRLATELDEKYELIKNYVLEDPGRRIDMSDFESEVDYLRRFFALRAEFLAEDLNSRELLTALDLRSAPAAL